MKKKISILVERERFFNSFLLKYFSFKDPHSPGQRMEGKPVTDEDKPPKKGSQAGRRVIWYKMEGIPLSLF